MLLLIVSITVMLTSAHHELLYRQKDGTGTTSYASLAARSSAEPAGPKTTPPPTSCSSGAGGPVCLANKFALLSDDSVESSERCDGNLPDLTKVTHVVDVHFPPISPKPSEGLTKRHHGSVESIDLAQPKQSKVSPGAQDHQSSRNCSAMVAPMVSVQPSVTPSVSDRASCDEDGLSMESSDDIITAVPHGPTVSKSAVQPDPRPPMTGRNGDNSHHSPVGQKSAVHRTGTSQLPVSSRQLIIPSQWNCRGLHASWWELRALLSEFFLTWVALQKTMLSDSTLDPRNNGPPINGFRKLQTNSGVRFNLRTNIKMRAIVRSRQIIVW
ncbi:hypothetical protein E2C01_046668 [Portunus trituberculatus]|uniref:Uncharacterized protein n=1 Tax=Portunus trituberculatus TaxID=210409 RepID=A0A5B7FYF7_PORTR|nr:hypothetical protein [Portunus trituberculatus]